jgi:LSD1 subclass zinc finger protein
MSPAQKEDLTHAWKNAPGTGVLDFVTGWWITAAEYMRGANHIRCAFVSTNSICQGEQAGLLWGRILAPFGYKIHFAHRTFTWQSEARGKAHVHCVIVGFGHPEAWVGAPKQLFDYEITPDGPIALNVSNISPYLVEANDLVAIPRPKPLCHVPEMVYGSKPTDGGHLIIEDAEHAKFLEENEACSKYVRPFCGSVEFINGLKRWCLWLDEADPTAIRACPGVLSRIESVKAFRTASPKAATRKDAATPTLFAEPRQPLSNYLLVPSVSSERRRYIPIGFMDASVVASNLVFVVPDADLWMFGILNSAMHMTWTRTTCGRLKSDYRYSNKLVYNNFPWPMEATEEQKAKVEELAQGVLDARALFPGSTLADLYDPLAMPPALAKAHEALDRAVERCYRKEPFESDRQRVEYLFALYERLTAPLAVEGKKKSRRPET